MVNKQSFFWQYLSAGQKGLIEEGYILLDETKEHLSTKLTDYSYLVFPFAKAYEGFLKKLFLDLGFIDQYQYEGDHYRIGKVLNPNLRHALGPHSIYEKLLHYCGDTTLADELWDAWKQGRNLLFHYFPHNLRAITLEEAEELINEIIQVMQKALTICSIDKETVHSSPM